jgi:hypothetical protein
VRKLTPAEEHRHLDFVAVFEELDRALGLGVDVMLADLRPEPNLLELDDLLVLAGLPLLLGLLVLEAAIVEQPADRRDDIGGYLDQVEVLRLGQLERLEGRQDTELLAILADKSNLANADSLVDAKILANGRSPLARVYPKV